MITSLDGYGATRNGGLVNSFTHTTLTNNFATLPHLHNHHQVGAGATVLADSQLQPTQPHIRFGTLPGRGNEKPPPPYPGNFLMNPALCNTSTAASSLLNSNGINYGATPVSSVAGILVASNTNGRTVPTATQQAQLNPVQTQVVFSSK